MNSKPKLVLDTNIIISALAFPRSVPRQAFDAAAQSGNIVASVATFTELLRTLHKPKLATYITPVERETFLHALLATVELVEITERLVICRDPQDDKFLELAVASGASWLITGDLDLLAFGTFRNTIIVTPRQFLERQATG